MLFHSYTGRTYIKMCHVAAFMSENVYLLPCGFVKLRYLSFVPQKCWRQQCYLFVEIFNVSYLKAHFKTTTTIVSTNFDINFIFDEWIIDDDIASKKGESFKVKCYPLTMSARSSHFSIPHPSQDQQLPKLRFLIAN